MVLDQLADSGWLAMQAGYEGVGYEGRRVSSTRGPAAMSDDAADRAAHTSGGDAELARRALADDLARALLSALLGRGRQTAGRDGAVDRVSRSSSVV